MGQVLQVLCSSSTRWKQQTKYPLTFLKRKPSVLGQDDAGGHGKQPCHGREGLITVVLGMQFGICWYDEICRSQHGKAAYMTKIRNFNCNDHHATCPWGRELAFAFRGLIMTYYSIYIYSIYFQRFWRESSKGGGHAPAVCKVCWSFELTLAQGRTPWISPAQACSPWKGLSHP
jgi:hypothetical protein